MANWLLFQIVLVIIAVCLFRVIGRYYYDDDDGNASIATCNNRYDDNIKFYHQNFPYYFSSEYTEAREKFHTAVDHYKNQNKLNRATTEMLSFPIKSSAVTSHHTVEEEEEEEEEEEKDVDDSNSRDDKRLMTIDVAILHGNTKKLGTIVHSSGVHGVEGYAGSAIQLAILELLTTTTGDENTTANSQQQHQQQDRPTIILIHAVNPVGMSEYRRCNENNVDLNRNCIIVNAEKNNNIDDNIDYDKNNKNTNNNNNNNNDYSDDSYSSFEDFILQRDPNIAGYDDFRHLFAPEQGDDDAFNDNNKNNDDVSLSLYETTIGYFVKTIPAILRHGLLPLKRAMVAGQYHHQGGLNYGGEKHQQSIQHLEQLFENDHPEFFRISPSVTWIDVHTGLGPSGKDSIDYQYEAKVFSGDEEQHKQRTTPLPKPIDYFAETSYSFTTRQASATASEEHNDDNDNDNKSSGLVGDGAAFTGYDLSKGFLMDFLADSYRRSLSIENERGTEIQINRSGIFITQEFGTIPSILVGRALILDNMLYQKYLKKKIKRRRRNRSTRRRMKRRTNSKSNDGNNDKDESITNDEESNYEYRSPFLKHAFYPQSSEWKKSIIQRGVTLFLQGIEYNKAHNFN